MPLPAEMSARYLCPVCGAENEVLLDGQGGGKLVVTEDCTVCCRPNVITCILGEDGIISVSAEFEG